MGLAPVALAQTPTFLELERAKQEERSRAIRAFLTANGPAAYRIDSPGGLPGALVDVEFGRPLYRESLALQDSFSVNAVKANELWPGGDAIVSVDVTGAGALFGIWEFGQYPWPDHDEFDDGLGSTRVSGPFGFNRSFTDAGVHATFMASLAAGRGMNPILKGAAFESPIVSYDDSADVQEVALAANAGVLVSNHSYGTGGLGWDWKLRDLIKEGGINDCNEDPQGPNCMPVWLADTTVSATQDYLFGYYNSRSVSWDLFANSYPDYTVVFAAGNDRWHQYPGYDQHYVRFSDGSWVISSTTREPDGDYDSLLPGPQVAKNIITVGAVSNIAGTPCPDRPDVQDPYVPLTTVAYSAWGPTDDGRIKPDFVAPGFKTPGAAPNGADPSDTDYWTCGGSGGTSNSAPAVSGGIALLIELQEALAPGSPRSAAGVRALLANTAVDLGAAGPDYTYGWGMPDFKEAAEVMQDDAYRGGDFYLLDDVLTTGGTMTYTVVSDGTPLRATLAWNDPAGTPPISPSADDPTPELVNDLDLRIARMGTTFHPWTLDPANPANPAVQTGKNSLDVTEQVLIAAPIAGAFYTVTINHDGLLTGGSQAYSLVLSGITAVDPIAASATLWLQGPFETGPSQLATDLNAAGALPQTQPYKPFHQPDDVVPAGFFDSNPDLVDYGILELRSTPAASSVVSRQTVFVNKQGELRHVDGANVPLFTNVAAGAYYFVFYHRNHLPVMSASPIALSGLSPTAYDFRTAVATFGTNAQMLLPDGTYGLIPGDGDGSQSVTGLDASGPWQAQNGLTGYLSADYDLDGTVGPADLVLHWILGNGYTTEVPD